MIVRSTFSFLNRLSCLVSWSAVSWKSRSMLSHWAVSAFCGMKRCRFWSPARRVRRTRHRCASARAYAQVGAVAQVLESRRPLWLRSPAAKASMASYIELAWSRSRSSFAHLITSQVTRSKSSGVDTCCISGISTGSAVCVNAAPLVCGTDARDAPSPPAASGLMVAAHVRPIVRFRSSNRRHNSA